MNNVKIVLVRHGETEWNIERRMQGQGDSPLTALGLRQAQCVGDGLRAEHFDHLYSSDLPRALLTAERITRGRNIPTHIETDLRERHFGIFQGLKVDEIRDRYPREFDAYMSGDADYLVPEGESRRSFWGRSIDCLERIRARHPGERLIIVLHGGVLNVHIKYVLGVPMGNSCPFKLYNAAINRVSHGPQGWSLETLGDTHHLETVTAFEANVY